MDKAFALHGGSAYFKVGRDWRRCRIEDRWAKLTEDTADIRPRELYTLAEVVARIGVTPPEEVPMVPAGPLLDKMTLQELKAYAADNGIDLGDATKKDEILAAILAAQEG